MLYKTANAIAKKLLRHDVIHKESYDVYVYGFELLLSFLFSTVLVLLIGALIHMILETVFFLAVFILLRSYTGGYHASKFYVCTLVTLCIYASVMTLSTFIMVNIFAYVVLCIVGLIALSVWAPIESPNKPISPMRKKVYKAVSIVMFLAFETMGVFLLLWNKNVGNTVFYTLCVDIALMIPTILKKGA